VESFYESLKRMHKIRSQGKQTKQSKQRTKNQKVSVTLLPRFCIYFHMHMTFWWLTCCTHSFTLISSFHSMCDIVTSRVINPLYHSDFLFHLSSAGRQHDRNLLVLHGMTRKVIKERREQMLQAATAASEDCDAVGEKKHTAQLTALIFCKVHEHRRCRSFHNFCDGQLCLH
jgi:hypothetical protein